MFQASLSYRVRSCLKKLKENQQANNRAAHAGAAAGLFQQCPRTGTAARGESYRSSRGIISLEWTGTRLRLSDMRLGFGKLNVDVARGPGLLRIFCL